MRPPLVAIQTCLSFSLTSKYYEKEALLMDPVDGPFLASLLGKWSSALSFRWISGLRSLVHPKGLSLLPPASSITTYQFPGSGPRGLVLAFP